MRKAPKLFSFKTTQGDTNFKIPARISKKSSINVWVNGQPAKYKVKRGGIELLNPPTTKRGTPRRRYTVTILYYGDL